MRRLIKQSLRQNIKQKGRVEYESMIRKAIKKVQNLNDDRHNTLNQINQPKDEDTQITQQLADDPKEWATFSVQQDAYVFEEQQKHIGDLERLRMKKIDDVLQTNTVFHETKPYEERIDTEHIMEVKLIKKTSQSGKLLIDRFLKFDPQERRAQPKFRSFQKFADDLQQIKHFPKHDKEASMIKTEFNQIRDDFGYLKLEEKELEIIMDQNKNQRQEQNKQLDNNEKLAKLQKFILSEVMYTDISLVKGTLLEDTLTKEFTERYNSIETLPLQYENFVYYTHHYSKDEPHFNLYRVKTSSPKFDLVKYQQQLIKNKELEEQSMEVIDKVAENEQVLGKSEIIEFLEQFEQDARVSYLIENIQDNLTGYHNIVFDKNHDKVAVVFDVYNDEKEFILIVKDIKNNTFFPHIITEVGDSIAFDDFNNFYFIRKSGLERPHRLFKSNMENTEDAPVMIYEEKDPNFKIDIQASLSDQFVFLEIVNISGEKVNEILYKEAYLEDSEFKVLVGRDLKKYHRVKVGEDSFYYTCYNSNEKPKNAQKLHRIQFNANSKELIEQKEKKNELLSPLEANKREMQKTIKDISESISPLKSVLNMYNQLIKLEKTEVVLHEFEKIEVEDFFVCEENEYIEDFEIFQNYGVILVQMQDGLRQYLKFYNFKTQQFHTLKFEEPLFKITQEKMQNYGQQYYKFAFKVPNQPEKIVNYNIAMRELNDYHTISYSGFKPQEYLQEKIMFKTRDDSEVPAVLVYKQEQISSESPILIKYEVELDSLQGNYELQQQEISLLDRGFVICYPILRGGKDLGKEHFQEGSQEKRLTNFCDLIDLAQFIVNNEISNKILLQGANLGALTCLSAYLNTPELFRGVILHNGIYNLADYLNSNKTSEQGFEQEQKMDVFGDFKHDQEMQDFILQYCPYQLMDKPYLQDYIFKNILVTSTSDNGNVDHSRKMAAKFRHNQENVEVYYKEFKDSVSQQSLLDLQSLQLSFLINSAFHDSASRLN